MHPARRGRSTPATVGYAVSTQAEKMRLAEKLSRFLQHKGLGAGQFGIEVLDELVDELQARRGTRSGSTPGPARRLAHGKRIGISSPGQAGWAQRTPLGGVPLPNVLPCTGICDTHSLAWDLQCAPQGPLAGGQIAGAARPLKKEEP
jgi:hypothetical protein